MFLQKPCILIKHDQADQADRAKAGKNHAFNKTVCNSSQKAGKKPAFQ